MPPKKADQRKSDVSAARFALKEDGHDADATASPENNNNDAAAGASASPPQQQQQAGSESGKKGSVAPEGGQKGSAPPSPSEKKDGKDSHRDAVTIEDLSLPKSIITRLAKGVLPANTQIQANAVLALSKSTTVFISHLAAAANEHTVNAGKKTILPADVFKALEDTEFGFLKEALEAEFKKFTTVQTEKRTSYRNKVKAAKADTSTQDADMTDAADTTTASAGGPDADGSAPRSKKARTDGAAAGAGAAAAAADEHDDAETEDDEQVHDDDDDQDQDDDDEDEDDAAQDDDETREHSGDETQDALEGRTGADEHDEALDGDESD